MAEQKYINGKEVVKHNNRDSCWIIVHGEHRSTLLLGTQRSGDFKPQGTYTISQSFLTICGMKHNRRIM